MAQLAADERVGTRFGEYRLDALIGVGGMGKVYRTTASDGTQVALKVVKPDLARDEIFRRRFRREARIAQSVRNRHLVRVRDTGEHEGLLYLAADFIDGTALDGKLADGGPLDLASTVRICVQIADALHALALAGMVHRDVKPANILLDRGGNAFLTDFGLAKDHGGSVLTRPGQPVGSMHYMAPEQIRGEPVTGAADTYALGCVVFECLTGTPPFADREGLRVLWAHLQDEPPDLSRARPDISSRVVQAAASALRKDPATRPRSSVDYARSLAQAAGSPTGKVSG
ncbi:MAG: serine/threonine protein kinase [Solirubrobacterales bacterium]|nr:serine/threonine protein kinase [Solirubrobacterales bacterium]